MPISEYRTLSQCNRQLGLLKKSRRAHQLGQIRKPDNPIGLFHISELTDEILALKKRREEIRQLLLERTGKVNADTDVFSIDVKA